ncbi:tyrosine-type recombinase/integrase, partial [Roseateles sp.]|uniref:tyrosine-type recombinase/integrase n=1 Tax=Roseateles sp. TaxID=1971397 RepID=UPI003BA721C8
LVKIQSARVVKIRSAPTPLQCIARFEELAKEFGLHVEHYDLRDLHVHDLRRTLGSWLASGGTSLPIIGKALNHKSPQATQVYARLSLGPVRDAIESATSAMLQAGLSPK